MTTEDVSINPDRPVDGHPRPAEKHRGPVTLRCRQIQTSTTDQRLLDSRGPSDTDPWRVLCIESEFVEGFGMLAELGSAISVFGSARKGRGDPLYALAERVCAELARDGYAVVRVERERAAVRATAEAQSRDGSEPGDRSVP